MTREILPHKVQKRLAWPLRLTWAGLLAERFWHAFWPLATVCLAAFAIWSFWPQALLNGSILPALIAGLAAVCAFAWGVLRFRWPQRIAALERLDDSLKGHPISALLDEQATGRSDSASTTLWETHQTRMAQKLSDAQAIAPDLRVAPKDPYALRLIALTGAVVALFFISSEDRQTAISATGGTEAATIVADASWEGWIEPPGYTGLPSLYLADQDDGTLEVPTGSRLTLRFYGDLTSLEVAGTISDPPISGPTPQSLSRDISQDGTLRIDGPNGASWTVTTIDDTPPLIRVTDDLKRQLSGDFTLGFAASDDYGIASGRAEIQLDHDRVERRYGLTAEPEPRDLLVVDLPLPFRGDRKEIEAVLEDNLAKHPWAGLPVELSLVAEDGAGQSAQSEAVAITLPAQRFLHPVARALIEQRRDILWSRENVPHAAQILRAISYRPEDLNLPEGTYLQLRNVIRQLETETPDTDLIPTDERDEIASVLWDIAQELENGRLEDARARMAEAQRRIEQAMRDGATPEELAELMDEFREAMRDYMDQLAQTPQDPSNPQSQPSENAIELSQSDIDAMMDRIEELMREGREAEAMEMLEALRQMMENMQVAQNGQSGQGDQARQDLQDTLREQQGLSDQAFRDLQEQGQGSQAGENQGNEGRDGGQGRGQSHDGSGGQQGQSGEAGAPSDQPGEGEGGSLSDQQRALQEQLGAQRRNLPGASDEAGQAARDALEGSGRAMGEAADALEEGDLSGALDRQAEAMEALREGLRRYDEAARNQRAEQEGDQGSRPGEGEPTDGRDPLGRNQSGPYGGLNSDGPLGDTEEVYRRAQELMEELRRKSGESERPELERDYLKRLLDQF